MRFRVALAIVGALAAAVTIGAQSYPADFPLWAYGYIEIPATWQDYSVKCQGDTPSACDRPGGLPVDPNNTPRTLDGSPFSFSVAQINARYGPADWFPNDHPPMPDIVAHGKRDQNVFACGLCHYPNGKGRMENAGVSGLPVAYFIQTMNDFRSDLRKSGEPKKANTNAMIQIAKALSPEEIKQAAEYFGSIKWTPYVKVVETDTVDKMESRAGIWVPITGAGAGKEPIGVRIVETPVSPEQTDLRNTRSTFIAYAPKGSIKKGEALVKTGGNGKTIECGVCHGQDLMGLGPVPGIAGRSPSYLVRQMYDMQVNARKGEWSQLMMPVVTKLSDEDLVNIGAYVASRPVGGTTATK